MAEESSNLDIVEELADEFLRRCREGEKPSIAEYCEKHPELADEIRDLFKTLALMENFSPDQQTSHTSVTVDRDDLASLPDRIGGYRIVRLIGRGGMGIVYEAEQESLERRVALKVLPQHSSLSDTARIRFRREARAAASMHHTNIVPVFEIGEEADRFYYAMQLIDGRGLESVIDELKSQIGDSSLDHLDLQSGSNLKVSPLISETGSGNSMSDSDGPNEGSNRRSFYRWVSRIGLQVAESLAYAHRRGVIHRDIKPSNLLLDCNNIVWVTDFGLAKTDEDGLTQTSDYLGTLRYMSPERFQGKCDPRADIYALGLTLYEMLVLRPAFKASDQLALIDLIKKSDPPKPRSLNRRIPPDLETIVLKATDKLPSHRYRTASDMASDLRRFLQDEPIRARRISGVERSVRWARRNKGLAATLSTVVVLLVIIAVGSAVMARYFQEMATERAEMARHNQQLANQMQGERDTAVAARLQAHRHQALAEEVAETNRQNLYFAEMILAADAADKIGGIRRVRELLQHWVPAPGEKDRRGPEWYYLNGLGRDYELTLSGHQGAVVSVSFSPEGDRLASAGADGTARIWSTDTGNQYFICEATSLGVSDVTWSPDGTLLASTGGDNSVKLWDTATGRLKAELKGHSKRTNCAAWRPDGKLLATGGGDGIRVWELFSNSSPLTFLPSRMSRGQENIDIVQDIRWHADGNRLISISQDGTILVWDVALGGLDSESSWIQDVETLKIWFGNHFALWSPSGDQLLAGGSSLVTMHVPAPHQGGSPEVNRFEPPAGEMRCVHWTGDGNNLITGGEDLELTVWDVETMSRLGSMRGHTGTVLDLDLSPSGNRIASASVDGSIKLWQFPSLTNESLWTQGSLELSPDGQFVAAAGGNRHQIFIADVDSGNVINSWSTRDGWIGFLTWSPTGRQLATGFGNGKLDSLVDIWDFESGELAIPPLNVDAPYVQSIAWHPTEENLIAVSSNVASPIEFWDVEIGERIHTMDVPCWTWDSLAWSPDGRLLAVAGDRARIVDWTERKVAATLVGHAPNIHSVRFSRDGRLLASTSDDGTICIYETDTWKARMLLHGHTGVVLASAWNPDSTRLATTSKDGTLKLWDTRTGQQALSVELHDSNPCELCWSRDGKHIIVGVNNCLRILDMIDARADNQ